MTKNIISADPSTSEIKINLTKDQGRDIFSSMLEITCKTIEDRKYIIDWSKEVCSTWEEFVQFAVGQARIFLSTRNLSISEETISNGGCLGGHVVHNDHKTNQWLSTILG